MAPLKVMSQKKKPALAVPMPLFLQGVIEAFALALMTGAVMLIALGGVWAAGGFADFSLDALAVFTGQLWLIAAGAPAELSIQAGSETVLEGTWWFLPLGWSAILVALAARTGARLARASALKKLWQPLLGAVIGFELFCWALLTLAHSETVTINATGAMLVPLLFFVLGAGIGVVRHYELTPFSRAEEWTRTLSQGTRWALSYTWSMLKAACVGLLGLYALSAVLLAIHMVVYWADITQVYQRAGAGIWGGLVLTIVQLFCLPNVIIWAASFTTGMGFSLGEGSIIAPTGTVVGAQPGMPLLSAVPTDTTFGALWWVMLIPVAAGIAAGYWFYRDGENHLGEWVLIRVSIPWLAQTLKYILTGLVAGIATFLISLIPFWASGGSWGLGKFTEVGPHAALTALVTGALIGLGVIIGDGVVPLFKTLRAAFDDRGTTDTDDDAEPAASETSASKKSWRNRSLKKPQLKKPQWKKPEWKKPQWMSSKSSTDAAKKSVQSKGSTTKKPATDKKKPARTIQAQKEVDDIEAPETETFDAVTKD